MFDQKLHDSLPETLRPLVRMAGNLWWTWNGYGMSLFRDIDPQRWDLCEHNPLQLLRTASPDRLSQMAVDPEYLQRVDKTVAGFDEYMRAKPGTPRSEREPAATWARQHLPAATADRPIAYFCAEYGIHESLPSTPAASASSPATTSSRRPTWASRWSRSGCSTARATSSSGVNVDGWQEEFYSDEDFRELPLTLLRDETNKPLTVEVPIRTRSVCVQIWRVAVGRDLALPARHRLRRERGRRSLDHRPPLRRRRQHAHRAGDRARHRRRARPARARHHAARLPPERGALGVPHPRAGARARRGRRRLRRRPAATSPQQCIFTTHTPVPAGNDIFDPALMQEVLGDFLDRARHRHRDRVRPRPPASERQHGAVRHDAARDPPVTLGERRQQASRRGLRARMWQQLWPDVPPEESPITARDQRRPSSDLGGAADARACSTSTSAPDWALHADDPELLEEDRRDPRRRAVARARPAARTSGRGGARSRRGASGARPANRTSSSAAPSACSTPTC